MTVRRAKVAAGGAPARQRAKSAPCRTIVYGDSPYRELLDYRPVNSRDYKTYFVISGDEPLHDPEWNIKF